MKHRHEWKPADAICEYVCDCGEWYREPILTASGKPSIAQRWKWENAKIEASLHLTPEAIKALDNKRKRAKMAMFIVMIIGLLSPHHHFVRIPLWLLWRRR